MEIIDDQLHLPVIIIITVGRTGSMLVRNNLKDHFHGQYRVIQSHNPFLIPEVRAKSICIRSERRDNFSAVLSMLVADITKEYHHFTGKSAKLTLSRDDFVNKYYANQMFYSLIDDSKYETVLSLYYEDVVQNPKFLFSKFGIDKNLNNTATQKSVYNYQELVTNFSNLHDLYLELENTPLTEVDKNRILTDFRKEYQTEILQGI
jgi:hypothetical protein